MSRVTSIELLVTIAAEAASPPWPGVRWRAIDVTLPAEPKSGRAGLFLAKARGNAGDQFQAVAVLELKPEDTVAYRVNLANGVPTLYIVVEDCDDDAGARPIVKLVSASPFRVQFFAESGCASVANLAMPARLVDLIESYIDEASSHDTPSGSACGLAVKLEDRMFGEAPFGFPGAAKAT